MVGQGGGGRSCNLPAVMSKGRILRCQHWHSTRSTSSATNGTPSAMLVLLLAGVLALLLEILLQFILPFTFCNVNGVDPAPVLLVVLIVLLIVFLVLCNAFVYADNTITIDITLCLQ